MTKLAPVEDDYSKIYLEDNVLHCEIKAKNIDLPVAKAMVNARLSYTKEQDYPLLIDASHVKSVTKEARDYFSAEQGTAYIKAAAIIAPSLIVRLLANFFLNFDKPNVPTKVFGNSTEALAWLNHYL